MIWFDDRTSTNQQILIGFYLLVSVPATYPDEAWYHYDDASCDYACMATEYMFWGTATNMKLLEQDDEICDEIEKELDNYNRRKIYANIFEMSISRKYFTTRRIFF